MTRPTGLVWKRWKWNATKRLRRAGLPIPEDWDAYYEQVEGTSAKQEAPSTKDTEQIRLLMLEVSRLKKEAVTHAMVREEILGLARWRLYGLRFHPHRRPPHARRRMLCRCVYALVR